MTIGNDRCSRGRLPVCKRPSHPDVARKEPVRRARGSFIYFTAKHDAPLCTHTRVYDDVFIGVRAELGLRSTGRTASVAHRHSQRHVEITHSYLVFFFFVQRFVVHPELLSRLFHPYNTVLFACTPRDATVSSSDRREHNAGKRIWYSPFRIPNVLNPL